MRFALSHPAIGTILVGMATPQQFEAALAAIRKGPLPRAARAADCSPKGLRGRAKVTARKQRLPGNAP
jgi:aryl-alcohol dehydrogenase-like predicted oxidoreductase